MCCFVCQESPFRTGRFAVSMRNARPGAFLPWAAARGDGIGLTTLTARHEWQRRSRQRCLGHACPPRTQDAQSGPVRAHRERGATGNLPVQGFRALAPWDQWFRRGIGSGASDPRHWGGRETKLRRRESINCSSQGRLCQKGQRKGMTEASATPPAPAGSCSSGAGVVHRTSLAQQELRGGFSGLTGLKKRSFWNGLAADRLLWNRQLTG
jgi:hypothetical protein